MNWFIAASIGTIILFFLILAAIWESELERPPGESASPWWTSQHIPAPILAWLACVIVVCLIMGVRA